LVELVETGPAKLGHRGPADDVQVLRVALAS
jgi:hypothetical protein